MKQPLTAFQRKISILVLVMALAATSYGVIQVSYAIIFIIAIPGIFGYVFWNRTYLRKPAEPGVILPPFIFTIATFDLHVIEEYSGGYSLAISRIFNFPWTNSAFFVTICILSAVLMLTCLGLYFRNPIAGFIAIMFIVTRFAEIALFIFPFIPPAMQPQNPGNISASVNGSFLSDLPNYYYSATQKFYFPGMFTVAFVMLPAAITIYKIWNTSRFQKQS